MNTDINYIGARKMVRGALIRLSGCYNTKVKPSMQGNRMHWRWLDLCEKNLYIQVEQFGGAWMRSVLGGVHIICLYNIKERLSSDLIFLQGGIWAYGKVVNNPLGVQGH